MADILGVKTGLLDIYSRVT